MAPPSPRYSPNSAHRLFADVKPQVTHTLLPVFVYMLYMQIHWYIASKLPMYVDGMLPQKHSLS